MVLGTLCHVMRFVTRGYWMVMDAGQTDRGHHTFQVSPSKLVR